MHPPEGSVKLRVIRSKDGEDRTFLLVFVAGRREFDRIRIVEARLCEESELDSVWLPF